MRISVIGSRGYPYVYSGYETFVRHLAERLAASGHEVTVYCHRGLFRDRPRRIGGIRLVYVPTVERKTLSQFIHSFLSILHACLHRQGVILVVNAANGPFGLLTRLFRKRTAINVDGLEWLRPKWRGLGGRYFHWAAKMATRLYDRVVTDSLEMQKIYRSEFGCESTCIAYGAEIPPPVPAHGLEKWGLADRGYYLVVGRLVPDNNADLIVAGFLASASPRRLVIVGDVPYRDRYAQSLKELGGERLRFTGYVRDGSDLACLYQHCHAYFHGHEFGGTNPALLTALANGCAVCALDTRFSREVLENGRYGLYFTKSAAALADRIRAMETEPARLDELRLRAPERIRAAYTWEKVTGHYCQLFADLLQR